MKIYNAMQLRDGAKVEKNRMGSLTQPIQFLPRKDKDEEWVAWCLDWFEWTGIKQINRNARRLLKNYKLAKGIIDKTDYIVEEDNELRDLVDTLTKEDETAFELKFYPIVPNIVNVLTSEFAKRNSKVTFTAVDKTSYNEMLELKKGEIEQVLIQQAQTKLVQNMIASGADPNDPEIQAQMQEASNPENLRKLPEIHDFYNKDYKSIIEQWASHQQKIDEERFRMDELEERGFRDMLITDREFWHFKMKEDDYEIELWNPVQVFYHKSPDVRYISQGNWVGKIDMMSSADVIDKYGYLMNQDQLEMLEAIYPSQAAGYPITGLQNDGSYYDATQSHEWNVGAPGLPYRQFVSMVDNAMVPGDSINDILSQSEDYYPLGTAYMLRVTTVYWKSQMKVGHLTKRSENGELTTTIITEEYKVTDNPIYDTRLLANKTKENLIFGEHIDWIYINQTWCGVKIGPNRPTLWGMNDGKDKELIYLGIDKPKPGPVRFQFKGDHTLYGCKLPVEGAVFSDRNTRSVSLVDMTKPFQIGYNIVNNQIADILIDELGTIILLDQNAIPRHSMGEDWGKNNLAKAYVAMKNFQMLPLDTSLSNTENPLHFQHFQSLNLEQTNRLMSRIQLANYFKMQCLEVIGLTPQRLGQQIGQTETARGMEQAVTGSYAQTETYFIQHSDYLMPRVHQMRTDLAQYYHSKKPSITMQYMTTADEKVNFQINGTNLLSRELNVFCTTKANHRAILEKMKMIAENNNTSGASIYDLGGIMQAESLAELTTTLKNIDEKVQGAAQAEQEHLEKLKQMEIEARVKERQMMLDQEALEAEKNRRKDILVAEIRAAGYGAMQDKDENKQNDFVDYMKDLKQSEQFNTSSNLAATKEDNNMSIQREKLALEKEKLANNVRTEEIKLEIARENKNKYDKDKATTKKKK
jgi:hypothetical protein